MTAAQIYCRLAGGRVMFTSLVQLKQWKCHTCPREGATCRSLVLDRRLCVRACDREQSRASSMLYRQVPLSTRQHIRLHCKSTASCLSCWRLVFLLERS